jgi:two-component system, chemotaxis family, sensor kinase CheA
MSASGHEEEFRLLFAQEAEQRLGILASQLLALEQTGSDAELVASIFREAHTLKGGAAVVGLEEVTLVTHAMEDLLEQLRAGERLATPELIDTVLAAVDGLQEMLPDVLAGTDRMSTAGELAERLRDLAAAGPEGPAPEAEAAVEEPEAAAEEAEEATVAAAEGNGVPAEVEEAPEAQVAAPTRRAQAVIDAETIRVPLARLDELVRLVGESAAAHLRVGRMVRERFGVDPGAVDEVRDLSRVLTDLQERAMRTRMVPVATVTDVLQRAVREVARSTGKDVRWETRGEDTELDRGVLAQLSDPLLHLVRNAVDHGIESPAARAAAGKPEQAVVRLHAMQLGSEVILTVSDDGHGIDVAQVRAEAARTGATTDGISDEEALYLIFRSGLSTASFVSDISGRGVGLDVVREHVEAARGRIEIRTELGTGSEFRIIVPITLAVLPCLLVEAGGQRHAIPMHSILLAQAEGHEIRAEGSAAVWTESQPVPLSSLATTLGLPPDETGPIVVVAGLTRRHAFRVSDLVGQREVVVKGLSRLLPRVDVVAGASVEPDGSILLVLDVPGLIDRARLARAGARPAAPPSDEEADEAAVTPGQSRAKLLVVDDAMTVRELQRSILERSGYEVVTAVDGVEALARLAEGPVDLVLTDVEMPRMDGFALTEAIRAQANRGNVPVLILTSRASEEDRQRGLEAGADGYIIKSAFNEAALVSAVERLLGR